MRRGERLASTLIILTPFLLPFAALARAPKVAAPVLLPINSQAVDAAGNTYLLTGTLTLTVTSGSTPIPPPVTTPALSYLTMAPASVVAGQSATVNVVLTAKVPDGQTVTVVLASADPNVKVPATVPVTAGTDHQTAPVLTVAGLAVEKLVAVTGSYNGKAASANLRVTPSGVVPPIPVPGAVTVPMVMDYRLPDGSPLVGRPAPGSEVRLIGLGFGVTPGRVVWQGATVAVVAWADGEVRVRMPLYSSQGQWEFALFRADGYWCNMQRPLDKTLPTAVRQ